ncbi:uncharacterized protein J4E87_001640 [Alternaria ethzedia]|uniref:uncharacterized protein n=1 Tax=Alternaria ethzedia TaxID=181014 RepID=UPI0020C26036|nr:uncharacterized protein J4E87_001640 [Alternaria ethzedia]KAI4632169.1 hypothetical protein J4E87_001640 [Alternaria ethzedia]
MTDLTTQKQQLQGSNNAQEKLYTMFEDTMEDLGQTTKDKLEAAENELETTKTLQKERVEKNEKAQEMLEQLKNQWSSLSHILGKEDCGR